MPELPEVESLKRGLESVIIGQKLQNVQVMLGKIVSGKGTKRQNNKVLTEKFITSLEGKTISSIQRRAKNIIISLKEGGALLIHLKMTGQLVYKAKESNQNIWGGHPIKLTDEEIPNKHTYIIFTLEKGNLYYNDVRQFGYVLYFDTLEKIYEEGHFDNLGLEPLEKEFNLINFTNSLKKRKGCLKKVFLDQKVVVGLGNIYADEVCFTAGVLPDRNINSLDISEIKKLFIAIKNIIPLAVSMGGSSVANYLLVDGSRGNYAREHKVYNRSGLPCRKCGNILQKTRIAGRTTVFCIFDQK
jgi:formamidopyrimidine-DNA glycosylase